MPSARAGEPTEVFGACGAACLMPKSVFAELGGFDEEFFVSHEDVDLSYRARLLGYRVRYVPDAIVHHLGSATLGRQSSRAVYYGQRNLEWVYLKNSPASILVRTAPAHLAYNVAAAVHFARAGQAWTFIRAKAAALAALPGLLRKRAVVQRARRVDAGEIWRVLEPRWLGRKMREKRFDRGIARVES
jgi:GT2 family glycosyltransferase